mmetsp:Transcript_47606/g.137515  ORF Transcript_47606/g.137515 Transcript_47606/m.137515 type:complete len:405 (-) Transcript_47606:724-1938(-)
MGALLSQPEDGWGSARPGTDHCELDPILDGRVFALAHPPDVALGNLVREDNISRLPEDHPHSAISWDLEGLVVGTVLLCLGCHQSHIGCGPHGLHIESSVLLAVLDDSIVDSRVAAVRDDKLGVAEGVLARPHLAAVAHGRGHRGVHDDVGGHVEVRDAPPGVHVGHLRPLLVAGVKVGLHLRLLWVTRNLGIHISHTIVGIHTELGEELSVLLECAFVEDLHGMAKHDGVGDLHHGRLQMQGEQHTVLRGLQLLLIELPQGRNAHDAGVDDLATLQGRLRFEHRGAAGVLQLDPHAANLVHHGRLLAPEEVTVRHVRDAALRVPRPGPQPVGELLGKGLHGTGHAAVRVALPQHGVHGAAQDLGVARPDVMLGVRLWVRRVVRHRVPLRLQLLDRGGELGHRR